MHTRFTAIVNGIYSFSEIIPTVKSITKLLSVLPQSWERKVEARDLNTLLWMSSLETF